MTDRCVQRRHKQQCRRAGLVLPLVVFAAFALGRTDLCSQADVDSLFRDPQDRFSVTVPAGWTAAGSGEGALRLTAGEAHCAITVLDGDTPALEIVTGTVSRFESEWQDFQVIGPGERTVAGRRGLYAQATGIARQAAMMLRIWAIPFGLRTLVLTSVTPQSGIASLGKDLEKIEQSLTPLGLPPAPPAAAQPAIPATAPDLTLAPFATDFLSLLVPKGWQVVLVGRCSELGFRVFDPARPVRQVFFFAQVGPLYVSLEQKQIDQQFVSRTGLPIPYLEMPVIAPLTATNLLSLWQYIARTRAAQTYMPLWPRLEDPFVVSSTSESSPLQNGNTELVRALFREDADLGEGLFYATVAPGLPVTGQPGFGTAYGYLIAGIAAPKGEFTSLEPTLIRCLGSLNLNESYVKWCVQQSPSTWTGILKPGWMLRETSDLINTGWEKRTPAQNVASEMHRDDLRGVERLYDPSTGLVYEFPRGFYEKYNPDRNRYQMDSLQLLPPEAFALWEKPTLQGSQELKPHVRQSDREAP
jgi:hypothetical protein